MSVAAWGGFGAARATCIRNSSASHSHFKSVPKRRWCRAPRMEEDAGTWN
jgi:hypothetical protein